jgi:hypothetical protein
MKPSRLWILTLAALSLSTLGISGSVETPAEAIQRLQKEFRDAEPPTDLSAIAHPASQWVCNETYAITFARETGPGTFVADQYVYDVDPEGSYPRSFLQAFETRGDRLVPSVPGAPAQDGKVSYGVTPYGHKAFVSVIRAQGADRLIQETAIDVNDPDTRLFELKQKAGGNIAGVIPVYGNEPGTSDLGSADQPIRMVWSYQVCDRTAGVKPAR